MKISLLINAIIAYLILLFILKYVLNFTGEELNMALNTGTIVIVLTSIKVNLP